MGDAVVRAERGDAGALAQLIAEAFAELPPSRWLIADPQARSRVFPGYFRIFVDDTLTAGVVHTTQDRDAAALWLPADFAPAADYPARLAASARRDPPDRPATPPPLEVPQRPCRPDRPAAPTALPAPPPLGVGYPRGHAPPLGASRTRRTRR